MADLARAAVAAELSASAAGQSARQTPVSQSVELTRAFARLELIQEGYASLDQIYSAPVSALCTTLRGIPAMLDSGLPLEGAFMLLIANAMSAVTKVLPDDAPAAASVRKIVQDVSLSLARSARPSLSATELALVINTETGARDSRSESARVLALSFGSQPRPGTGGPAPSGRGSGGGRAGSGRAINLPPPGDMSMKHLPCYKLRDENVCARERASGWCPFSHDPAVVWPRSRQHQQTVATSSTLPHGSTPGTPAGNPPPPPNPGMGCPAAISPA